MPDWKVPLADVRVTEEDIAAVADTYRSGWLSMGPRTTAFEEAFASYVGVGHAFAVSSGTAALHLMCLAADLGPDDEVLVPSMTFVATANAIRYTGATPVFVDITGVDKPWMSVAGCERAVTGRTRAILYVDYGGHAGDLEELVALADGHGLVMLQDAAHAIGGTLHARQVGAFGLASAYSFFSNKNLAIGEGGMVVTDDARVAERIRVLRSHGMTTLSWDRHRGHATTYDVVALGFNYRIDEPRAALGTRRLARLDDDNALRHEIDLRYRSRLEEHVHCAMPARDGVQSSHHIFTIVLPPGVDRAGFRVELASSGVQTSIHYPPVHRFAIHSDGNPELPLTDQYAERTVTLPLFAHMTAAQQDLVIDAVIGALAEARRP